MWKVRGWNDLIIEVKPLSIIDIVIQSVLVLWILALLYYMLEYESILSQLKPMCVLFHGSTHIKLVQYFLWQDMGRATGMITAVPPDTLLVQANSRPLIHHICAKKL